MLSLSFVDERISQLAAILYYDYILTFSAEVSHIWPQPISWNTFLFYSNRYIAFATKIISATLIFSNIGHSEGVSQDPQSCWHSCINLTSFPHRGLFCVTTVVRHETETLAIYSCYTIIRIHEALLLLNQVAIAGASLHRVPRDPFPFKGS